MLKTILCLLFALLPLMADAQISALIPSTNTSSTNAPSTNAPAATAPIVPGDVVAQAEAAKAQLQQYQGEIKPDPEVAAVEDKLGPLSTRITTQLANDAPLKEARSSITLLQSSQHVWLAINSDLDSIQDSLSDQIKKLDGMADQVNQLRQQWQATLSKNQGGPAYVAPASKEVLSQIAATATILRNDQGQLFDIQSRAAVLATRAKTGSDEINKAVQKAWENLFQRDHPPLWSNQSLTPQSSSATAQERLSIDAQEKHLITYIQEKVGAVIANLILFAILAMAFFWLRNAVHALAKEKLALSAADRIFETPVAAALLASLVLAHWLYPSPPDLFHAAIGTIALVPTVIIIRRLIEAGLYPLLYVTVAAYITDQVRFITHPYGVLSRALLIAELIALCIFLLVLLRAHKRTRNDNVPRWVRRVLRNYLHATFVVLIAAGFANVLGYLQLSSLLSHGMLRSSYAAIIIYAAVHVLDALALSALYIRPLVGLRAVRRNQELLYDNISLGVRWGAMALWVFTALEMFQVRTLVWQYTGNILSYKVPWGWLEFQIGPMLAFPITVYASFLISRFVRFCLEEEVYPNVTLAPGIPYALSTVIHYVVLIFGFYIALAAVGVDLNRFSILVAAFGVGLGFGLQNIMNNFMSGLILLFERPIKVGDTIQIDAATVGRVERIGIRASVILLTNGAELIVPNGNLISNPVTNWTLSNCERAIELPVKITTKVEPQKIMDILTKAVKDHPSVLKNPPPQALLVSPGGATQEFRLRAWIDSGDAWQKITSDLSLAVNEALEKENIAQA